jgi:hypothetical protein
MKSESSKKELAVKIYNEEHDTDFSTLKEVIAQSRSVKVEVDLLQQHLRTFEPTSHTTILASIDRSSY